MYKDQAGENRGRGRLCRPQARLGFMNPARRGQEAEAGGCDERVMGAQRGGRAPKGVEELCYPFSGRPWECAGPGTVSSAGSGSGAGWADAMSRQRASDGHSPCHVPSKAWGAAAGLQRA